jgi:hypothetical protein
MANTQGSGSHGSSGSHSTGAGIQGGTHEQHVKAGEQSHKNTSGRSSTDDRNSEESKSGSQRTGTHEQHVKAGQQNHKNT